MKHGAIAALLAALWTGVAAGQAADPAAQPPTPFPNASAMPDPTPRPSVVPANPNTPAMPATPRPMPRNVQAPVTQAPPLAPSPPAQSPSAEKPAAPATTPILTNPTPIPTPTPIESMEHLQSQPGVYSTRVLDGVSPWTAKGRRFCGSVYMDTPYWWLNANYTASWIRADKSPPLVTTGPANSANPGVLTDPKTTVLFTGQQLHDEPFNGGQFNMGMWFDECQLWGIEGGYFFFGAQDRDSLTSASGKAGTQGLYIPFFNPLTNKEDVFVVADPGNASGIVRINSRTFAQGVDGHALLSVWRGANFRVDGIVGARWISLSESVTIEENVRQFRSTFVFQGQTFIVPTDVGIYDRFQTRNDFAGFDIGLKSQHRFGCWTMDILGRVAIGGTHETLSGEGWTGVTIPQLPTDTIPPGRLIGPFNIGSVTDDQFSVVPEFGLTLGWQPRHWLKFTVGYDIFYWANVARPGMNIDRVINPQGVPTRPEYTNGFVDPARPTFISNQSDFWAQSVSFGMQFMY